VRKNLTDAEKKIFILCKQSIAILKKLSGECYTAAEVRYFYEEVLEIIGKEKK
jgi:hypothetical protein